jgi:hypothetical protein
MLNDATNIRISLHMKFYSSPSVIEKLGAIMKENPNQISSLSYDQTRNSIQVHLKKLCLKKIDSNDSLEFYNLFNGMLNKLFLLHRDYLIYIFNQDLPQSGIDSFNKLINYTNMFYSIKKISPNTFIIDL